MFHREPTKTPEVVPFNPEIRKGIYVSFALIPQIALWEKIGDLSPLFLLDSNFINNLGLHQILGTKTTETKKLLKTDANEAYY